MKIRCDVAILMMAAKLYVSAVNPPDVIYAVCGCECIQKDSERLECQAKRAKEKEIQIEKIERAIKQCEESQ